MIESAPATIQARSRPAHRDGGAAGLGGPLDALGGRQNAVALLRRRPHLPDDLGYPEERIVIVTGTIARFVGMALDLAHGGLS
jgi:hypothetical protein